MMYRECPDCGAHLDFGEKCDCRSEAAKRERFYMENMRTNPVTGQMSFNWEEEKNEKTANKCGGSIGAVLHISYSIPGELCG